jgi:para-nitrobenzyl esterase
MRAQGLPVYVYRFGYVANTMRGEWKEGPPHATDIPYAMDTVKAKYGDKLTPTDEKVAQLLHAYWVNFVRSGDPNGKGLPKWPVYERKDDVLLQIHPDGSAAAAPDPRKAQIDSVAATAGH